MTSQYVPYTNLGTELCEALGLTAKHVTSIDLHISAVSAPTLDVHMIVPPDKYNQVTAVIKKYRIVDDDVKTEHTQTEKHRRIKVAS